MNLSFFTGLGDSRWFTGGYISPPPPLILQGWGRGSHPLLQGYSSATSPESGAAGGMAQGGALTASGIVASAIVGAGGIDHGSAAVVGATFSCTASGGLARGGTAPKGIEALATAPCGVAQSGITPVGRAIDVDVSGGSLAGGEVTTSVSSPVTGLVGTAQGGKAAIDWAAIGAGGMRQGGRASSLSSFAEAATGGARQGGRSRPALWTGAAGAGGQALGASGPTPRQSHEVATSGGLRCGLSAAARSSWTLVSACGVPSGGLSPARQEVEADATGGLCLGGAQFVDVTTYRVYGNAGIGDPINYATPLAVVEATGWTSRSLAVPGHYRFGVRAGGGAGLEEHNLDAAVELILDEAGRDVTAVPPAPLGVRAVLLSGGRVRLEWSCPCADPVRRPVGFRVYVATSPAPGAVAPAAVVPWSGAIAGSHSTTLENLSSGVTYYINIRAFNDLGEETNTRLIAVAADGTPPSGVDALGVVATSRES